MSKNKTSHYVEMPLFKFIGLVDALLKEIESGLDPCDTHYIVRLTNEKCEIGYRTDNFKIN